MKEIINELNEAKARNYNDAAFNANANGIKNVVDIALDQSYQAAIFGQARPQTGRDNVTTRTVAAVTLLWCFVKLVRVKPALFPRIRLDLHPPVLDARDVVVGWKFFVFMPKQVSLDRVPQRRSGTAAIPPEVEETGAQTVERTTMAGPDEGN